MATMIRHLIGRDTNVQIVPCTVDDVTGVLTEVTASNKNFAGRCDRFEVRLDPISDDFSSMDAERTAELPLKDRWSVVMTEIQRFSGAHLADLIIGWRFFKITSIVGGKTWIHWVSYGPGSFPYEAGKSVANIEFRIIDVGTETVSYENTA